jgi:hypothetical protein
MATNLTDPGAHSGSVHAWGTGGSQIQTAMPLSLEEQELVNEVVRALRTIRFGSVSLTVHDGRLVEIQKTEKIRKKAT